MSRAQTLVEADRLLHRAWTTAVGTPSYDKAVWLARERALWAPGADVVGLLRAWGIAFP